MGTTSQVNGSCQLPSPCTSERGPPLPLVMCYPSSFSLAASPLLVTLDPAVSRETHRGTDTLPSQGFETNPFSTAADFLGVPTLSENFSIKVTMFSEGCNL